MKFYIKPKHFARYRSFKIRDEGQGELFKIKGTFLLGMRSLTMTDMSGQTLYIAKIRPSLSPYRTYDVMNEKREVLATIKRGLGIIRPKYPLNLDDETYHFEGTVHTHTFAIASENAQLVRIQKGMFSFGEAFEVEVLTDKRSLLHLFLVVVIDQLNHERKKFHV